MPDLDLCYTPATELAALIRERGLSPVELIRVIIERVETCEPRLNAFATFTPERAIEAAKACEVAMKPGAELGPLHGIPVTIKDLADTAGIPTMRGSRIFEGRVPEADTVFVSRLKDAGAVILGKTTTSEFGWTGVSRSPLTGITSNPWRAGFNAGASSAGATVGAAAGYGPLHQGTDGAGSIRMPAHFCGTYGLKPTYGRVPNVPVRNNDQIAHSGPMTRTVADAALMLEVMSGAHPLDHYSLGGPRESWLGGLDDGIAGLKVAYSADLGHARVDDEVAAVAADGARAFEDLGVTVAAVDPPFGPDGPELARFLWTVHVVEYADYLDTWRDQMDPGLVACIEDGLDYSARDYLAMRQRKLDYVAGVHAFFQDWDLLLTPAVSVPAFPADRLQPPEWPEHPWDWLMWAEFSYPFNLAHNPAASVPAGFTTDGLPVGLQIVGRRFEDAIVLRASAAFEAARPWAAARPPLDRARPG